MKYLASPFALGSPVYGDKFFGRKKEISEIFSLLQGGSAVNFYSLTRMGKTSLMYHIRHLCKNDANWKHYQPISLDMAMFREGDSLAYGLLRELGITNKRGDNAWREVEQYTKSGIGKSLLLLDDIGHGFHMGNHERDFAPLRSLQQAGLINIVTSTLHRSIVNHPYKDDGLTPPFYNIFHVFRLPSFLPEEAEELLITLCKKGNVVLDPNFAKELAWYVGYYPNLVQEIGHIAFGHLSEGRKTSLKEVADEWRMWSGYHCVHDLIRSLGSSGSSQEEPLETVTRVEKAGQEIFLTEAMEDYGILLRDEAGHLVIAQYVQDLLERTYSSKQILDQLLNLINLARSSVSHLPGAVENQPLSRQQTTMDSHTFFSNLRNLLADLYPDEVSARRVVDDTQLDARHIAFSTHAVNNWHAILSEATKTDQLDALLGVVLKEYGTNQQLRAACDAYRTGRM